MKDLSYFSGHHLDGLTFCKEVYALFEEIRSTPDGVSNLRLKASVLEKKLLEELFPICRYIQTKYKPGLYLTVQWIDGNQQFDALMSGVDSQILLGQKLSQFRSSKFLYVRLGAASRIAYIHMITLNKHVYFCKTSSDEEKILII